MTVHARPCAETMTCARTSKRLELEHHDGDILPRSINPNPNSIPNSNPNRGRGSWNQSPLSGRDPEQ